MNLRWLILELQKDAIPLKYNEEHLNLTPSVGVRILISQLSLQMFEITLKQKH